MLQRFVYQVIVIWVLISFRLIIIVQLHVLSEVSDAHFGQMHMDLDWWTLTTRRWDTLFSYGSGGPYSLHHNKMATQTPYKVAGSHASAFNPALWISGYAMFLHRSSTCLLKFTFRLRTPTNQALVCKYAHSHLDDLRFIRRNHGAPLPRAALTPSNDFVSDSGIPCTESAIDERDVFQ